MDYVQESEKIVRKVKVLFWEKLIKPDGENKEKKLNSRYSQEVDLRG